MLAWDVEPLDSIVSETVRIAYGNSSTLGSTGIMLVTQQPGESFLDKMIALVEGATRKKTPNEIALTILLAGLR